MHTMRLRLYGLAFLAVLALLLSLAVAVYQQAFTSVVPITLEADTLGNQLDPRADVKLRGLLVGEVREVHADGTKAILDIALNPQYVPDIPSDVHARLLPKTLFGEKYVELVAPADTTRPIQAGDVITQDRTKVGIEVQQLMNDLLPLLRTVQPGELNATLSAFATALEGRGDRIGDNLTRVEGYLRRLNPHMPSLKEDITRFADVAEVYGDAAPDLMRILRNTVTTSHRTIVEKKDQLASALRRDRLHGGHGERLPFRERQPADPWAGYRAPRWSCSPATPPSTRACFRAWSGRRRRPRTRSGVARCGSPSRSSGRRGPTGSVRSRCTASGPARTAAACRIRRCPGEAPSHDGTSAGIPATHFLEVSACPPPGPSSGPSTHSWPLMGVAADQVPPVATLLFGPLARGTAVSVA